MWAFSGVALKHCYWNTGGQHLIVSLVTGYYDISKLQPRTAASEGEAEDVEERLGAVQAAAEGDREQSDGETSIWGRRVRRSSIFAK